MQGATAAADTAGATEKTVHKQIRVMTDSSDKASKALEMGCSLARETVGLSALICDSEVASSLGLQEDIRLFAEDIRADSQIGASSVQRMGDDGTGRKIVVLDTGYNVNHPELASSYLGGRDFVNDDSDPSDDNGHGSHVAGLITADGHKTSAKGAAPGVGIIAGKVLDSDGSGYFSDVVAGIYWAVNGPDGKYGTKDDYKADAINLSAGTEPPFTYTGYCNSEVPSMTNAIKYAKDRGVLVVVAAGNWGTAGVSIPGCISHSITVGAVNKYDRIASFSGRGKAIDIVAPGVNLVSTWLGTGYATESGTSMATPLVSATIALIKHENPSWSAQKVQDALFNSAVDLGKLGKDNSFGHGRVDVMRAVG